MLLLREPPAALREDFCRAATHAKTLREVTASDGWTGDVCGNCHFDFHKMQVQFKATENA